MPEYFSKYSCPSYRHQVRRELRIEGKLSMYPDEDEIDMLLELVEALEILEAGTRILCSRDMDLARADEGCNSIDLSSFNFHSSSIKMDEWM